MAKILVIDDEKEICEITRSFLSRKHYDVTTATCGKEAMEIVAREKPQVILLDLRLGSESGLDLLEKIRQVSEDSKVVMVTALDDDASIRQAQSLGAADYITKPFSASFLYELINKLTGAKEA